MTVAPSRTACRKYWLLAIGCCSPGFAPWIQKTSAFSSRSAMLLVIAPAPRLVRSAHTVDAWHIRVQLSMLLVP